MLKDIGYGGLDQYSKAYNRPRSLKTVSRLRPNFVVALLSVLCYKFHVAHHILNAIISMKSKKVTRQPWQLWTNCMDMITSNSQFLNSIQLINNHQQSATISNNRLQVQQAFNILVYILITTSCEYLIAYLN